MRVGNLARIHCVKPSILYDALILPYDINECRPLIEIERFCDRSMEKIRTALQNEGDDKVMNDIKVKKLPVTLLYIP
jgi:hypothetical protein